MILDKAYCSVYGTDNEADPGGMPSQRRVLKYQAWYGELDFGTSPFYAEGQEDVEIAARIRIPQNRAVSSHDVVVLAPTLSPPPDCRQYEITRAFHGTDEESGQPITDLSLRRVDQIYDLA